MLKNTDLIHEAMDVCFGGETSQRIDDGANLSGKYNFLAESADY